jgi:sugar O-acyltransferase (sialic acid O-acetyltransferase NeuD family)
MKCVIVGAGGHGRVVLDILVRAGGHDIVGFLDSNPALTGKRVDGKLVYGTIEDLSRLRQEHAVEGALVAIGNNGVRRDFADRIERQGLTLINAVHPSANLANNVTIGRNVVVAAGALVCAHCHIGDSVILNTGCIVDHESMIGPGTHVCPGARLAGRVLVESGAFVGIGATIIQNLKIGYNAVIGAGAVVIRDVAPNTTVVGVPAHPIHEISDSEDLTRWLLPVFGSFSRNPAASVAG